MKTTIEVNGEQIEVDLDNLSEEELKAYNIKVNNGEEGFIRPKRRALRKIRGILPLICIMAFFLCGFLIPGGWCWSWSILLLIPLFETLLSFDSKPVRRIIATIATLIIIAGTIFIGSYFGVWSWCWVFFLLIPIVHILAE